MTYYFSVINLYLSCTNSRKEIVSNSVDIHNAHFTLDSMWDKFTSIKAIFTNSNDNTLSVEQLLDANGECMIPSSPISKGGDLIVKLVGETSTTHAETTMNNDLVIKLSSVGNGGEDTIFTPSIVTQLTDLIDDKGDTLTYADNTLSLKSGDTILSQVEISGGGGSYTLPTMSDTVKGGATVGTNLTMNGTDLNLSPDLNGIERIRLSDMQVTPPSGLSAGDLWREDGHAYYKVDSDVVLDLGRELYELVLNQTGSTIQNGSIVYQSGAVGASGLANASKYLADGNTDWANVIGIATEDIPNGATGNVTVFGAINGLNTSAIAVNGRVYASSTVAGAFTGTKPTYSVCVGTVLRSHATTGIIFVRNIHADVSAISPTATVTKVDNVATITITDKNGTTTATVSDGEEVQIRNDGTNIQWKYTDDTVWTNIVALSALKGVDGRSVSTIAKTGSVGLVDTYTITYSDSTTSTYSVTNGAKGDSGRGVAYVSKIGTTGLTDTYAMHFDDGTSTNYNIVNGANGVGVSSISKTGTSGLVDTYTITYSDSSTSTYTVTNGSQGVQGYTPYIDSTTKHWFINGTDTGVLAQGTNGADGLTTSVSLNGTSYTQSGGVITLPSLEPSLPSTPTNPETKYLNGNKQWTEVSVGSGGYASNIYCTNIASDISGYYQSSYIPQSNQVELSATVANQEILARSYLYPSAIQTTQIDAGTWSFVFMAKVSNTSGSSYLRAEPFLRHIDGSETTLFSFVNTTISNTTYLTSPFKPESTQPVYTCLATDRLGVRIYVGTSSSASITINTLIGDGKGAYFTTPLKIRHSQLRDLNSDASYQHVAQTWINSVNGLFPTGTLDTTSSGTVTKELVANTPIKISIALTSLTLNFPTTYNWYDVFTVKFKTSALSLPSGCVWDSGTTPTIDSAKWYEVSIRDNVAIISGGSTA